MTIYSKTIITAVFALVFGATVSAQTLPVRDTAASGNPAQTDTSAVNDTLVIPEGYELVDTVVYRPVAKLDSTLVGKSIFSLLPSKAAGDEADVLVYQSGALAAVMKNIRDANRSRSIQGFRIRIFSDNRQTARTEAESIMKDFEMKYPDIPAYISYANPYFKVTVGDFRTRSEAMRFLKKILPQYQKAFIVKEGIAYPAIDRDSTVVLDTIQILRPVAEQMQLSL